MHPRIAIRNHFVNILTNATDCGDKVYKNRARPFINVDGWVAQLPAMVVMTNDEESMEYAVAPLEFKRVVNVVVAIHAAQDEDTDDFLDHVAEQVEQLVSRYNWEAEGYQFSLGRTETGFNDYQSSHITGGCSITFQMTYYSVLPDAGKTERLDDFVTSASTYQIGSATNKQTVTLP